VRLQGKVEPLFVDAVAGVADAIRGTARDGDVVLIMGAGSIGSVAGTLVRREG
jgi:UDP-N-acetylmuramate--alanine ligase